MNCNKLSLHRFLLVEMVTALFAISAHAEPVDMEKRIRETPVLIGAYGTYPILGQYLEPLDVARMAFTARLKKRGGSGPLSDIKNYLFYVGEEGSDYKVIIFIRPLINGEEYKGGGGEYLIDKEKLTIKHVEFYM